MATQRTYEELEAILDRGKSVILPDGRHIDSKDKLPSKADLAKGDPAAESRVKTELIAEIQNRMAQLNELGVEYRPVNELIEPTELPEDDPRREHSTVPKNAEFQPRSTKQEAAVAKSVATADAGGAVTGATAPVDARGEKVKGTKTGTPPSAT